MTIGEVEEKWKDLPKNTEVAIKLGIPGDEWAKFVKLRALGILLADTDDFKSGTVYLDTLK